MSAVNFVLLFLIVSFRKYFHTNRRCVLRHVKECLNANRLMTPKCHFLIAVTKTFLLVKRHSFRGGKISDQIIIIHETHYSPFKHIFAAIFTDSMKG